LPSPWHEAWARAKLGKFSDGEVYFQILENVRGAECVRRAAVHESRRFHLMELLMMRTRSSAPRPWRITRWFRITLRAPGRKDKSARADFREARRRPDGERRANRALTLDCTRRKFRLLQRAGRSPVRFARADRVLREENIGNLTVVSPDAGRGTRGRLRAFLGVDRLQTPPNRYPPRASAAPC